MTAPDPQALKACPFCGGVAVSYERAGHFGVRCAGECPRVGYLEVPRVSGCREMSKAIAIWNDRRAPSDAGAALEAEAKRLRTEADRCFNLGAWSRGESHEQQAENFEFAARFLRSTPPAVQEAKP